MPAIDTTPATLIAVEPSKVCKACGKEKKLDDFGRNSGCADGREGKCKLCRSAEKRAYRLAKLKEKLTARLKASGINKAPAVKKQPAAPQPDALAVQVGGSHYKHFAIQPIEFSTKNKLGFIQGDIVKRICRYNLPGGKGIQDLQKIKHEVDCLIEIEGLGGAHV
jgi:CRISPR/Cas system-associated protein Cas10 (large subunit of type III CRISPR-Cas system)